MGLLMHKGKSYGGGLTRLLDMLDVNISNPSNGDAPVYNSTSQRWENVPIMTKEQWKKNGAYNLCPNENTTQVIDGVTFTVNSDRSVTVNGTCGSTGADFDVPNRYTYNLGIGTYKLVGCPSGGSTSTYMIGGKINGSWVFNNSIDTGNGAVINVTSAINAIAIRIKPGTVCNNLLFKPMITTDLNATYDDYVEYAKTNRQLTELATETAAVLTKNSTYVGTIHWGAVWKNGYIKVLDMNFNLNAGTIPNTGVLFTIPNGFRPKTSFPLALYATATVKTILWVDAASGEIRAQGEVTGGANYLTAHATFI